MRPHRWQPTRLPRPWDSPGKNTGVGCHFLLQCMKVKRESEVVQLCLTLSDPMDCSLPGSSVHGLFQARVLEWGAIAFSVYHCTTWEYTASKMVLTLNFYLLIKITFRYKCFYTSFDPNWKWNAISLMRFIIILWKIGLKSTDPIFLFWADAFNIEYTLVNFIFIVQKWY